MKWLTRIALVPGTTRVAGLVGFGYLPGLGNDTSIALSLARRMRDILSGEPARVYRQSSSEFFKGTGNVRSSN